MTESSIQDQFYKLSAETMALQAIIFSLCRELIKLGPPHRAAVYEAFETAASIVEHAAIREGVAASPKHVVEALRIVEEIRGQLFNAKQKPTGVVDD